jgi:hypothetical protein
MSAERIPLEEPDEEALDLRHIEALLQFKSPEGRWHARAKHCVLFGHGATPAEAVAEAMERRAQA